MSPLRQEFAIFHPVSALNAVHPSKLTVRQKGVNRAGNLRKIKLLKARARVRVDSHDVVSPLIFLRACQLII